MDVVLVTFKPSGKRVDYKMRRATLTIGRGDECNVRIPAASVSRKHCELVVEDDRLRVKDLGSANGTYVNGDRVAEVCCGPGDMLTVGRVNFLLQIDGEPADIEPFKSIGAGGGQAEEEPATLISEDEAAALAEDAADSETPGDEDGAAVFSELPGEAESDDADFLAVFESPETDTGDSAGVSLDGAAEPEEEDPLSALEMLAEEAPDETEPP